MQAHAEHYTSLCEAGNSVLLVIDIQTELTAITPLKVLARLQRNTSLLIRTAVSLGLPIFATERSPERLGRIEPEVHKLLPETTPVYQKTSFTCMGAKNFAEDLTATKRKQAILVGMEAHVCILQTALDLHKRGYIVFVVADSVCSRQRENYEIALRRLARAGIIICDAESVLFEWIRGADEELSLQVQGLLR
ncbi:MAG: isochorismatase family protein [Gammaproteobacteria bacterium]|nr:isochorismatase family protein [Gammaproteobacteria bacterium]MCY4282306.1 isochorismatase family protein [Gammaproteobacteria bacterium]MCY4338853.1 isochorismatase family protein [Gammaproteobacteria bacterium]